MGIVEYVTARFSKIDVWRSRIDFLNFLDENDYNLDIDSDDQYTALKFYTMGYLLRDRHGQATMIQRRPAWLTAKFDPIIGLEIRINERNSKHADLCFEVANEMVSGQDRERIKNLANNLSLAIIREKGF